MSELVPHSVGDETLQTLGNETRTSQPDFSLKDEKVSVAALAPGRMTPSAPPRAPKGRVAKLENTAPVQVVYPRVNDVKTETGDAHSQILQSIKGPPVPKPREHVDLLSRQGMKHATEEISKKHVTWSTAEEEESKESRTDGSVSVPKARKLASIPISPVAHQNNSMQPSSVDAIGDAKRVRVLVPIPRSRLPPVTSTPVKDSKQLRFADSSHEEMAMSTPQSRDLPANDLSRSDGDGSHAVLSAVDGSENDVSMSKLDVTAMLPPVRTLQSPAKSPRPHGLEPTLQTVTAFQHKAEVKAVEASHDTRVGRVRRIKKSLKNSVKQTMKVASAASAFLSKQSSSTVHPEVSGSSEDSTRATADTRIESRTTDSGKWKTAKAKLAAVSAITSPVYGPNSIVDLISAAQHATIIVNTDSDTADESEAGADPAPVELNVSKPWIPPEDSGDEKELVIPPPVRSVFKRRPLEERSASDANEDKDHPSVEAKKAEEAKIRQQHIQQFGAGERRTMAFCMVLSAVSIILAIVALCPLSDSGNVLDSIYYGKAVSPTPNTSLANATAMPGADSLWLLHFGLRSFSVDAPHPYTSFTAVVKFPQSGSAGEVYEDLFSSADQSEECYVAGSTVVILLLVTLVLSTCRCDATKHRWYGPSPNGNTPCSRVIAVVLSSAAAAATITVLAVFRQDCFRPSLDDENIQADYGPAFFAVAVAALLELVQLFLHASIPSSSMM